MSYVTMKELLEAGVHFGHQTSRWNPRMRPYIFTARNGIHIIDLEQTQKQLDVACDYLKKVVADGQKVLLAVKSMGGESAEAWRTVLDDLIKRELFWALLASGQINMRKIDGWQTITTKFIDQPIDLAA